MELNDKAKRKWRNYRWAIGLCVILGLVCLCLIIYDASPEHAVPGYLMTLVNSTLGAIIGIVAVNLVYQWHAEKDLEDDMTQTVLEALSGEDSGRKIPRMYTLYKKSSIERILKQCLESYCTNKTLANAYLSYIRNSYQLIKKDEEYEVEVSKDESDGRMYIMQKLCDTRVFLPEDPKNIWHKSYLIFKKGDNVAQKSGVLDGVLNDSSYYFREELTDPACVGEIVALCKSDKSQEEKTKEVLRYLKYKVEVYQLNGLDQLVKTIPLTQFEVRLDTFEEEEGKGKGKVEKYCGLFIEAAVPQEAVKPGAGYYEEEGYLQYRAKMNICYSIPADTNTFYAVFPVPTYKSEFKIRFDIKNFNCRKHLDYMTFLSFADVKSDDRKNMLQNDGTVQVDPSSITFSTVRTIFPRSGFTFCWDTEVSEKSKIELKPENNQSA